MRMPAAPEKALPVFCRRSFRRKIEKGRLAEGGIRSEPMSGAVYPTESRAGVGLKAFHAQAIRAMEMMRLSRCGTAFSGGRERGRQRLR